MLIFGVALLAICYLTGQLIGEYLGLWLGIGANVGGVGFAMLFLVITAHFVAQRGWMRSKELEGVSFWSQLYIPVIVAMAAILDVKTAFSGGLVAILAGIVPTAVAFMLIPLVTKLIKSPATDHENLH